MTEAIIAIRFTLLSLMVFIDVPIDEMECLAVALHFESGSEVTNYIDRESVGHVILNRVKAPNHPNTICTVIKDSKQFSFYNDGKSDNPFADTDKDVSDKLKSQYFLVAIHAAINVLLNDDTTGGADHYHANNILPSWTKDMTFLLDSGHHKFYMEKSLKTR